MEPVQFSFVGVKVGKVAVAADMVPVNVGGYGGDRLLRQPDHLVINIADAQAGVDKQAALRSVEQITVGLLPVAVLAENGSIWVDLVQGKPVFHGCAAPFSLQLQHGAGGQRVEPFPQYRAQQLIGRRAGAVAGPDLLHAQLQKTAAQRLHRGGRRP